MKSLVRLYARFSVAVSYLQSPFLLAIRLYWGWQFAQAGLGKLQHLDKVTRFFASLNIPFPAANASLVSSMEFIGGILLVVGLGTRLIGLVLAFDMIVAYWTASRDALSSIFSDPGKFYGADPYTFLFAAIIVMVFGTGLFSVDAWLAKRFRGWTAA